MVVLATDLLSTYLPPGPIDQAIIRIIDSIAPRHVACTDVTTITKTRCFA